MKEKKIAVGAMVCLVVLALVITIVVLVAKQGGNDTITTPNTPTTGIENNVNNSSTNNVQKKELIYNSTEAFDYDEVEDGIIITYFKNYDYVKYDKIIIPSEIDGKTVVGIGALEKTNIYYGRVLGAIFGNCEVVIPSTVTYIGGMAFQDADGLVKLSGGENCKIIGEYAFMNCENLSEITFLDNVTDIADNAFAGCTKWQNTH